MSEPLEILAAPSGAPATVSVQRRATVALLICCIAWGGSFTWAKRVMEGINLAGGQSSTGRLGVLLLLSWRFLLAGVIWMFVIPGARQGWSWASIIRSLLLGLPFTAAMIVQQMGLTRTSEAVNAFLTCLTVLFVPLMVAAYTGRLPRPGLWSGVALAMIGVWLLNDAAITKIGAGQALGLACAALFSLHMLLINGLLKQDSAARLGGGQFLVTGLLILAFTLLHEPRSRESCILFLPFSPPLAIDVALLVVFSTLLAFGLMIYFQPRVDPTRAAFIYLTEPIFATLFAIIFVHRTLSVKAAIGAALIIVANSLVEWLQARPKLLDLPTAAAK